MRSRKSNKESEWVKGLKKGKHESFQHLFRHYSQPLYRFSLRYLKSAEAAEDVVQEVFFKVWKKRKSLNTDQSFQAYLFTIALNAIRKQFNKLSATRQMEHDLLLTFSTDGKKLEENEDYQELLQKLEFFINQLPEKRQIIFRAKKLEGKTLREIAEEHNITPKTVEYHITESMKFLKKKFEKMQLGGLIFFHLFLGNPQDKEN